MPATAVALLTLDDRLEELAFQHGQAYDSYLSTEKGLEKFWSSDQNGVVTYARIGRFVHVQGGLLCPLEHRAELLREFFEFARQQRYVATFYNIGEAELPLFRGQGFQVTKWGEEPLLDVPGLTWAGHDYEWVRRQANYCRRQNAVLTECRQSDYSATEWTELIDEVRGIADECLSTKPQRGEVQFFNGSIDPPNWSRRRLFVARSDHGTGRVEGFLICLPFDGGHQWAIETYRHRLDAPRGLVAFMIHQAVEHLKIEGVQSVSLCLCPAVRYERLPNDSWIIRRCLQFGFNYASAFFDMPGEYHFKSRFRPRFVRRFICHWPHASIGSMWSIVRLSGVLNLDLKRLTHDVWQRFVRPKKRCNLSLPVAEGPSTIKGITPLKRRSDERVTAASGK
jgi:phosphatidylglycerol lysyltransferase